MSHLPYHARGHHKVRIAVVNGGVLAGGDALDADIGVDAVAFGRAHQSAGGEVGGMAYLEFHIYGITCFELLTP